MSRPPAGRGLPVHDVAVFGALPRPAGWFRGARVLRRQPLLPVDTRRGACAHLAEGIGARVALVQEAVPPAGMSRERVDAPDEPASYLDKAPVLLLGRFGGDGAFPVFGEYEDGELLRVIVEFVDPPEDE